MAIIQNSIGGDYIYIARLLRRRNDERHNIDGSHLAYILHGILSSMRNAIGALSRINLGPGSRKGEKLHANHRFIRVLGEL
jgi:hypothetical protein